MANNPQFVDTALVVGRGRVYFDKFVDGTYEGTGERYFGNTPTLTLTQAATKLDHFSSDQGLKQKDRSVTLQNDMTGKISTDNIVPENQALFWLGDASALTVVAAAALTESFKVFQGRSYQLGVSDDEPMGKRALENFTVKKAGGGGAALDAAGYYFDPETGRLDIFIGSPDVDVAAGQDITVTYDQTGYSRNATIAEGAEIYGALRFVADNAVGLNQDFFAPYVQLTSDGDYNLKGDDWQTMGFNIEVLKLANREKLYIDGRPLAA